MVSISDVFVASFINRLMMEQGVLALFFVASLDLISKDKVNESGMRPSPAENYCVILLTRGFAGSRPQGNRLAMVLVTESPTVWRFAMPSRHESSTAVLGLGLIGSIWARHLDEAGLLAASWNRTPRPDARKPVATPHEAAEHAKTLIIVVADPPAVESVLRDMMPALTPSHLVIQSSTIGPADAIRFRKLVQGAGARYLESPFTGSKPAAEAKKTVFYQGGDAADVAAAEPVLACISAQRIHIGTPEQACTVILVMNLQIALLTEALGEALYLAREAGVGDDLFFTCMKNNASWSGLAAMKEPKLRAADYAPQFSVKHLLKDLRLLKTSAGSWPGLDLMITRLQKSSERGHKDKDFTMIYEELKSGKR